MDIKQCMKIHGYVFDSDSECSGKSDFDEEYYKLQPPPIPVKEDNSPTVIVRSDCAPQNGNNINKTTVVKIVPNTTNKSSNFAKPKPKQKQFKGGIQNSLAGCSGTNRGAIPKRKSSENQNSYASHNYTKKEWTRSKRNHNKKGNVKNADSERINKENTMGHHEENLHRKETDTKSIQSTNVPAKTYSDVAKKNTNYNSTKNILHHKETDTKSISRTNIPAKTYSDVAKKNTIYNNTENILETNSAVFDNLQYKNSLDVQNTNKITIIHTLLENNYDNLKTNEGNIATSANLFAANAAANQQFPENISNKSYKDPNFKSKENLVQRQPVRNSEEHVQNRDVIDVRISVTSETDLIGRGDQSSNNCIVVFFLRLFSLCCAKA